jgi:photosystem II stability/assembly factor-like uncharacterized protein
MQKSYSFFIHLRKVSKLNKVEKNFHSIKFIEKNTYSIFDFVNFDDKFLGYGSEGSKIFINENLFMNNSWKTVEILPKTDENPVVKNVYIKDNNIWAVAGRWIVNQKGNDKWKKIAELPNFDLISIAFADDKTGFILARLPDINGCQVYKTVDGGINWKKVYENKLSGNPFDLLVVNEKKVLLAINDNYIIRTENGGINWTPQGLESENLIIKKSGWVETNEYGAAKFATSSDNKIWVVGKNGSIYYSDDEGYSWKKPEMLPDNIKEQKLHSISFSPTGKGIAIGQEYIMITEDFGKKWIKIDSNQSEKQGKFEKLWNVNFINERGVVIGKKGIYEVVFNEQM